MAVRKQYYFMYKGRKIEPGTVLKFRPWRSNSWEDYVEEVIFEWYIPEKDIYVIKYLSTHNIHGMTGYGLTGDEFRKYFVGPTTEMDVTTVIEHKMRIENSTLTWEKEIMIEGMKFAWILYIILMGLTSIFNGRIFYWALISLCFFIYRTGKLKENGYSNSFKNKGCGSLVLGAILVIAILLIII